jgi:ubiquinone biosynthesis protein
MAFRRLVRTFSVLGILIRYLLPGLMPWRRQDGSGPVRLRTALERLGGTWIKLGQALALRFDLLPPDYCYELFNLLDQVRPFPYEVASRIIEEDLERSPETIFRSFDREPLAAGSIGQVHRAVLHSGREVAVKVQRPKIGRIIATDISLMYLVAGLLDLTRLFGARGTRQVIDEFARWTAEELDFLREGRHAHNLWRNAQGDPLERDAQVFFQYSTHRVLTMEFIDGIPLIEIIRAARRGDHQYLDDFKTQGHDLDRVATHITWNLLNQVYQQGYFHADLHPANLFVLPGDVIGYVDFGIIGTLSADVRDSLAHYARSLFAGDASRAAQEFMRWIAPSDKTDRVAARDEFVTIMEDYLFGLRDPASRSPQADATSFEVRMLNAIRRHGMTVSPSVVAYLKALVTANTVIFELAPDFSLEWHENKFFGRMVHGWTRDALHPGRAANAAFEYSYRVLRSFEVLEEVQHTERDVRRIASRVRRRLQVWGTLTFLLLASLAFFLSRSFVRVRLGALPLVLAAAALVVLLGSLLQIGQLPREGIEPRSSRRAMRRRWRQLGRRVG